MYQKPYAHAFINLADQFFYGLLQEFAMRYNWALGAPKPESFEAKLKSHLFRREFLSYLANVIFFPFLSYFFTVITVFFSLFELVMHIKTR